MGKGEVEAMKRQQYIVWSLDTQEAQTFTDVLWTTSPERAAAVVARARPYAVLDSCVDPMLLTDYIASLQALVGKRGGKRP